MLSWLPLHPRTPPPRRESTSNSLSSRGAWNAAVDDTYALVEPLTDEQWNAQTPCPGWSVADVVAHSVDIESWVGGLGRAEHTPDFEALPHVKSPIGQFIETGIDLRRGRPKADILAEFRQVMAERRSQIAALEPRQEVRGLMGNPVPVERQLATRVFDLWAHEQDIRAAVGQDGDWGTLPARVAFRQMTKALPFVWVKGAGASAGDVLRYDVIGPFFADTFVVAVDDDGMGDFVDDGDPTVHLVTSWPDTQRLMCGRVDIDDPAFRGRITLTGDEELGRKLLGELSVTP